MADRLEALKWFVAVCDDGGFTAAACSMGVAVSTVTRSVTDLEKRLGVQLLQRSTRAIRQTEAGAAYLREARSILAAIASAEELVREKGGLVAGRLRVSAPVIFGRRYASGIIARFMSAHPGVEVELFLSGDFSSLISSGIDLAVRIGRLEDSALISCNVGSTRPVYVASPAYLAEFGTPSHPSELSAFRLAAFSRADGRARWAFTIDDRQEVLTLSPNFFTDHPEAAIEFAVAGGGILAAQDFHVRELCDAGLLQEVLGDYSPDPQPIQVVLPQGRHVSHAVRSLLDAFVDGKAAWDLGPS